MTPPPLLRMAGIGKAFSGVTVLDDVDFELRAGETHALLGGNGAGKSTLMKILEGVYTLDHGTVELDGEAVELGTPQAARRHGVAMIFQEFSLVPTLTVAQNIYLTREARTRAGLLDDRALERRAAELLAELGVDIDPRLEVGRLSTASLQLVEIAKALSQDARILIMDEPTASLAHSEVDALFQIIERLKERGITIVYITHRLEEVITVADRVTVLRDGSVVGTRPTSELDMEGLIELIVGRSVGRAMEHSGRSVDRTGTPLLSVRDLSTATGVRGVDLDVHAGEIVGIAGLMGSGRSELARAIFGVDPLTAGDIRLRGERVRIRRPADAVEHGIVLVPEDRRAQGLVLAHGVGRNLTLVLLRRLSRGGMLDDAEGERIAQRYVERLGIRTRSLATPVRRLSGGNQQKVVLAKWLATEPELLILDEPTVGVDIGTRSEIVDLVRDPRAGRSHPRAARRAHRPVGRPRRGRRRARAAPARPGGRMTAFEALLKPVRGAAGGRPRFDVRKNILYIGFVVLFVVFAITLGDQGFTSSNNLLNIIRQTATISVMAVAVTFVIGAAEIDLSVGSVAGLASVICAMALDSFGLVGGIAAGLLIGALVGAINGGLVVGLGIPSFLVTLGMLGIAHGTAQWITNSAPQPILDDTFNNVFGTGDLGPIPSLVIWTAVAVAIGHLFLRRTAYGRGVLATGGNEEAARFSGVPTRRIKFTVMMISAMVAAIAGMLYAGRLQSGRFQWGEGDELSVIAAVILGGTSLFGGRASVIGALLGSLMIGLINNGLILMGLEFSQQQIVRGVIIILAVALAPRD
jgi:ribose transport system ATP-binding protein